MRAPLLLTLLLVAAWLLWSGMFKPLLVGLGVFSCVLTVFIIRRMGYFDRQVYAFRYDLRLVGFWLWLLPEIARSSLEVARVVLSPKPKLNTEVIELDVGELDRVDQALLGNSITLTPGTLTLEAHNDKLVVHALTAQGAQSLREGEMQRRVAALHGGTAR
ncbi:MAG: Na+/H+ antiporter subunit E [Gammaproteobacteria bacterium]|nr:Na+/H+ antiporter subunit E [Gammaproteobacteria bacterium]MCY4255672.1 Na+/H+ antiporter subunit E [Gammaproteobacteria bacterium]MCY4340310.1 Na+/H+ antiporter subunit E [Gammaproteobacteria bacterium]